MLSPTPLLLRSPLPMPLPLMASHSKQVTKEMNKCQCLYSISLALQQPRVACSHHITSEFSKFKNISLFPNNIQAGIGRQIVNFQMLLITLVNISTFELSRRTKGGAFRTISNRSVIIRNKVIRNFTFSNFQYLKFIAYFYN